MFALWKGKHIFTGKKTKIASWSVRIIFENVHDIEKSKKKNLKNVKLGCGRKIFEDVKLECLPQVAVLDGGSFRASLPAAAPPPLEEAPRFLEGKTIFQRTILEDVGLGVC